MISNFFANNAPAYTVAAYESHLMDKAMTPGAPLTCFNEGGGGGGPKDIFGFDILAKRDFFGSMKDAGSFLGRENNTGIFWGIVFFISSNQK